MSAAAGRRVDWEQAVSLALLVLAGVIHVVALAQLAAWWLA